LIPEEKHPRKKCEGTLVLDEVELAGGKQISEAKNGEHPYQKEEFARRNISEVRLLEEPDRFPPVSKKAEISGPNLRERKGRVAIN